MLRKQVVMKATRANQRCLSMERRIKLFSEQIFARGLPEKHMEGRRRQVTTEDLQIRLRVSGAVCGTDGRGGEEAVGVRG